MTSVWFRRGKRLWLVVCLPAALLCFFVAWQSFSAEEVNLRLAHACEGHSEEHGPRCPGDHPDLQQATGFRQAAIEAEKTAEWWLLGGVAALLWPISLFLVIKLHRWLWRGSDELNEPPR